MESLLHHEYLTTQGRDRLLEKATDQIQQQNSVLVLAEILNKSFFFFVPGKVKFAT